MLELELHSNFIAKNGVFGAVYCRMEPVLVQDLFISIFIGHIILDSDF